MRATSVSCRHDDLEEPSPSLYHFVKRSFDEVVRIRHRLAMPRAAPLSLTPSALTALAAPPRRFVTYLRVSTEAQGRSGLGLDAQRQAVAVHLAQHGGELLAEFQEIESGRTAARPQLAAALACCRTRRAALLVAKLDRLSRDARFLLNLVEGAGEAGVVFCDLPTMPPGPISKFMLTQMAAAAELEAGLTGQRTRAALAAAKARGVKLGNPRLRPGTPIAAEMARAAHAELAQGRLAELRAVLDGLRAEDILPERASLRQIATVLETRGVRAPQGGAKWSAAQVQRVLAGGA